MCGDNINNTSDDPAHDHFNDEYDNRFDASHHDHDDHHFYGSHRNNYDAVRPHDHVNDCHPDAGAAGRAGDYVRATRAEHVRGGD